MSSRYKTTSVVQGQNDLRRFGTTMIPNILVSTADTYIQVTSVERLDKLANKFYGDSTLWWIIAAANFLGKGTIVVPTNTVLRIPAKTNIQTIINNINIR